MLTLNDGRTELWQWDTGRTLAVDADCSQVHFSNKVFGRSIDVDVIDGIAIVPDILLQTDKDLNVWAFVGTAENGYTKISKTFKVNRRNKPSDYVFTPPDQTSLEEIKERIDALEEKQDPDAIKNAVEDYLEQNPVEVPVQSVNGQTGEVKLTAGDVGAISQDDLQEATNEALAKAKESGEFDGEPGRDYVLTDEDKAEIAELAAELVEIPDSGGNVAYDEEQELTEEQKAQARANIGAQPVGEYLTEVPEGYAKNEDIKKVDRKVDTLREVVSKFHSNIVCDSKGEVITVSDASDMELSGLRIFGKTTQNGTPTPEAPVELVSVGDGGSVSVTVCGKNLFADGKVYKGGLDNSYGRISIVTPVESPVHREGWTGVGIRVAVSPNNTYTVSSDITPCKYFTVTFYKEFDSVGSKANAISFKEFENRNNATFTTPENCYCVVITSVNNVESDFTWSWWQVEHGSAATVYEPYEGQTLSISTPNGLPGIPVTSGGNYTDANGQQWICDEVDFGKGVYVQRVGRINSYNGESIGSVYLSSTGDLNAGATVLYPLSVPIETALSAEELAAYAALHTNYPNTTVYNDGGAGMEVKYVADTKLYVDKKFAELSAALLNQ